MAEDVIFELDLEQGSVVFHQNGPWAGIMEVDNFHAYSYNDIMQQFGERCIRPEDRQAFHKALGLSRIRDCFAHGDPIVSQDFRMFQPSSGEYRWFCVRIIAPISQKCHGIIECIHEKKEQEIEMARRASTDSLTSLLNRGAFKKRLIELLNDGSHGVLGILDIDNFKHLNDSRGHLSGDSALVEFSLFLSQAAPEGSLVGRFGGDEFLVFFPGDGKAEALGRFMERLRALCSKCGSGAFTVSAGFAKSPEHGITFERLLDHADRALYVAKAHGKDGYFLFSTTGSYAGATPAGARKPPVNIKRLLSVLGGLLAVLLVVCLVAGLLVSQLRRALRQDSATHLQEVSQQASINIANILTERIALTNSLTILLEASPPATLSALNAMLAHGHRELSFDNIALVEDNGAVHSDTGYHPVMTLSQEIRQVLAGGEPFMTGIKTADSTPYVAYLSPMSPFTVEGHSFVAFVAFVSQDTLGEMLDFSVFGHDGACEIVDSAGNLVVHSPGDSFSWVAFFSSGSEMTFVDGSRDELVQCIQNGGAGVFRYQADGVEYLSCCSPIGVQDWMMISTIPAKDLEAHSSSLFLIAYASSAGIAVFFLLLLIVILWRQTARRSSLEEVLYKDNVTGGATRALLNKRVPRLLSKDSGDGYSLIYANIYRFKVLNERFGIPDADNMLRFFNHVIEATLDPDEMVARLYADHFAILLHTRDPRRISRFVQDWTQGVNGPGMEFHYNLRVSYGVYQIDDPSLPPDLLVDRANLARRAASENWLNNYSLGYYHHLVESLQQEQELEDHMSAALEAGEFLLYLQEQRSLKDESIVGYESLVRWNYKGRHLLPPDSFVPLFEHNGAISQLDLYLFNEVCQLLTQRLEQGLPVRPISVNVSRNHLLHNNFLDAYFDIWSRYALSPELIIFEFTETAFVANDDILGEAIDRLHAAGFRCAMDDFGSGYSSLNLLYRTRVDIIKLDRSFLGDQETPTERGAQILRALSRMAAEMHIVPLVEGVENRSQAELLKEWGYDLSQGFLYGHPLPADQALASLSENDQNGFSGNDGGGPPTDAPADGDDILPDAPGEGSPQTDEAPCQGSR